MIPLMLITAVTFWGLSFIAVKICLPHLSPIEIIAARMILAAPFLAIVSRLYRFPKDIVRRNGPVLAGSIGILVLHLLIQVEGLKTTTATNAAWLITTIPVFIVVLSFFFLKERISLGQGAGMAVAAFGVIVLVSRGKLGSLSFLHSYGDWLVLASCLTWSIYTLLTKRLSSNRPLAVTTLIILGNALILVPPVVIVSGLTTYMHLPLEVYLALFFLGIPGLGIAYWLWIEGLNRRPAGQVGVYLYVEPLSTSIAAPFILGERITIALIAGAILVVSGVWWVERQRISRERGEMRVVD